MEHLIREIFIKKNYASFFLDKKDKLSEDSRKRFEKNILRIFDSKDEKDKKIMKDAPLLLDNLDNESKDSFEIVKESLKIIRNSFRS